MGRWQEFHIPGSLVVQQLVERDEGARPADTRAAVNQDGSRFDRLDLESSNRVLARNNFQKQEKETYMQLLHLLHHVHQLPAKFILSIILSYPKLTWLDQEPPGPARQSSASESQREVFPWMRPRKTS